MSNWHNEETYKSLIQISISALRFVIIANGGAAIAILALVGQLYSKGDDLPQLYWSLGFFLAGVFIGGLAHVSAYITQLVLYNEKEQNQSIFSNHELWLYLSIILVFCGILCFGLGAWSGVSSMLCSSSNA